MKMRSPETRAALYYGGSIVIGVPLALAVTWLGKAGGPGGAVAATVALLAVAHGAFVWYWRRLDEPARAAQKDGIFWGFIAWLYLMTIGWVTLGLHPIPLTVTMHGRTDPAAYVALGLVASLIVFLACFLVAWGYWWLRRR